MKSIVELARLKRAEINAVKLENDNLKGKRDKADKVAIAVKKMTKAEHDALPKALQKELKEFRN